MSWVLAGGVFAAVIGPQLVIFTKDLLAPHLFAASYLGQSGCALVAALVLQFVKVPPLAAPRHDSARPLGEIARSSRFIVAVACGMASFGMGAAFYGRAQAYRTALAAADEEGLVEALTRNIYSGTPREPAAPARLAAYIREAIGDVRAQQPANLLAGEVRLPDPGRYCSC